MEAFACCLEDRIRAVTAPIVSPYDPAVRVGWAEFTTWLLAAAPSLDAALAAVADLQDAVRQRCGAWLEEHRDAFDKAIARMTARLHAYDWPQRPARRAATAASPRAGALPRLELLLPPPPPHGANGRFQMDLRYR